MNDNDAVELALTTLANVMSIDFKATDVEIGVADKNGFRSLSIDEIDAYLVQIAERD